MYNMYLCIFFYMNFEVARNFKIHIKKNIWGYNISMKFLVHISKYAIFKKYVCRKLNSINRNNKINILFYRHNKIK